MTRTALTAKKIFKRGKKSTQIIKFKKQTLTTKIKTPSQMSKTKTLSKIDRNLNEKKNENINQKISINFCIDLF